jgi:hypothetical protein
VVSDPAHHGIVVDIWGGGKPEAIGEANHVLSRTIVKDGLIVGFWEVDPAAKSAVWWTFEPASKALASSIDKATADTAKFLLEDVGNVRTFSLDTVEQVQERADRIGKLRDGKAKKPAVAAKRR